MVQLKYFGDSRDYFKYDLITSILKKGEFKNYAFIPMLTNHRVDGEGNKVPKYVEGKSQELLAFIDECASKDLEHWAAWLGPFVKQYQAPEPVNSVFFSDQARTGYWDSVSELLTQENALVFLDPDTGLETGKPSYLRKMGREKYLLNEELAKLYQKLAPSSVMMVYQHLPNNKHIHEESVYKKMSQAADVTGSDSVQAYREDDLAFIFLSKNSNQSTFLKNTLSDYHRRSGHKYKSLHLCLP